MPFCLFFNTIYFWDHVFICKSFDFFLSDWYLSRMITILKHTVKWFLCSIIIFFILIVLGCRLYTRNLFYYGLESNIKALFKLEQPINKYTGCLSGKDWLSCLESLNNHLKCYEIDLRISGYKNRKEFNIDTENRTEITLQLQKDIMLK